MECEWLACRHINEARREEIILGLNRVWVIITVKQSKEPHKGKAIDAKLSSSNI